MSMSVDAGLGHSSGSFILPKNKDTVNLFSAQDNLTSLKFPSLALTQAGANPEIPPANSDDTTHQRFPSEGLRVFVV